MVCWSRLHSGKKFAENSRLDFTLSCALHSNHKQVLAVAMPSNLILPSNVILHVQDSWKQEGKCSFPKG